MRVPESWLRQWVPTDASAEQMADALTMDRYKKSDLDWELQEATGVGETSASACAFWPNQLLLPSLRSIKR